MRRVGQVRSWAPTGPLTVFVCLLTLLGVLAATIGLDASGWLAGVAYGAGLAALLARVLTRHSLVGLGPADSVTLARAVLACGVAALTVDSFGGQAPAAILVALSTVVLVLDGVDGRVARRTNTTSAFGARFDIGDAISSDDNAGLVRDLYFVDLFYRPILVMSQVRPVLDYLVGQEDLQLSRNAAEIITGRRRRQSLRYEMANRFYGEIPNNPPGTTYLTRREAWEKGVHRETQGGISGDESGSESIVVSGGYADDEDHVPLKAARPHRGRSPR